MRAAPWLALVLSPLPGAWHLATGLTRKGFSLLFLDAGVLLALYLSQSRLLHFLALVTYLAVMIPAAVESYSCARTGRSTLDLDSRWFVICMLIMTGVSALALLWQSRHFTRADKILWTLAVVLLGILYFGGLCFFWKDLELWLDHFLL